MFHFFLTKVNLRKLKHVSESEGPVNEISSCDCENAKCNCAAPARRLLRGFEGVHLT
jgi:hypothetical protein